jgi:murein L,D-transpeptidase YcbB/YkuD
MSANDLRYIVEQIRRDMQTLAEEENPVPGRAFYETRIARFRLYAKEENIAMQQELQQTADVLQELSPALQQRITAILSTYQEMKLDLDLQKEAVDAEVAKVYALLKEEGISKTKIEGIASLTEVGGDSSKLDKIEFVRLGGNLDVLAAATKKTPKKKYLLITLAGEKEQKYGNNE